MQNGSKRFLKVAKSDALEACVRGWSHRLGPLTRASRLDGAASGVLPLGISSGGDWLNFQRPRLQGSKHVTSPSTPIVLVHQLHSLKLSAA